MTRKLTLTSILVALNVVLGMIVTIPLGAIRAAPVQHLINVLGAVLTGPWVVLQAFVSSTIRVLIGTGTPFAYPGSMIGALLAWLMYRQFKKLHYAAIGEVAGTGIIGALMTYPLILVLGLEGEFFFVLAPAFIISSLLGAVLSWFILMQLEKRNVLHKMQD